MQAAQQIARLTPPPSGEIDRRSDEMLVALLCARDANSQDAGALDALFDRYARLIYAIALRILHDAGEAEEVVQESFLYVFRKAGDFEPSRGSAKVWIVQIAYSRARDRKEHLTRRGFYSRSDLQSASLEDELSIRPGVENEVEARIDLNRLQGAFDDLTKNQRETLEMYYFEGLGLREISERLNEPLGNVRHRFYRGLDRLRRSAIVRKVRSHNNGKSSKARQSQEI